MSVRRRSLLLPLVLVLLLPAGVLAQAPRVVNARVEQRSAADGLGPTFDTIVASAAGPAWIGYVVPAVAGQHLTCCNGITSGDWAGDCGPCRLEGGTTPYSSSEPAVKLEGPRDIAVLYRVDARRLDRIRSGAADCALDAGGLPFYWVSDVRPADSIALLDRFVRVDGQRETERVAKSALTAIALHADPGADRVLQQWLAAGRSLALRRDAAFWLGQTRGRAGFDALQRAAGDLSPEFRKHLTFALSVSRVPEALDVLFRMAREDQAPEVRGQALFWIAQKAGTKAAGAITEAIEKDPDTEVKRRAVFALSQMPKDEGVPRLIQVARNNANPAVRKQAMFWLGQSKDPRALAFFQEVLSR
jgi:HEAT repeat protein